MYIYIFKFNKNESLEIMLHYVSESDVDQFIILTKKLCTIDENYLPRNKFVINLTGFVINGEHKLSYILLTQVMAN